jgi:hypothetical protein
LAGGLVRGAKTLETDANPRALRYVSDLLTEGDIKNMGKAGARLVPLVFDKVFGPRPFSFRFISRSILATTLFWLVLLSIKHPNWKHVVQEDPEAALYVVVIPLWYILDWLSLVKAKYLIRTISQRNATTSSILFMLADIACSYLLSLLFSSLLILIAGGIFAPTILLDTASTMFSGIVAEFVNLSSILEYFVKESSDITFENVIVPSTLLTSVWTFLLFVSCLFAQLLIPIDYLRKFTTFWFKDVEKQPLTAIAKVAATLIVAGAFAIKAVRWVY